jgi:ring-1,2-phenylacetyl-CoA epoxidase subunit PaaE
VTHDRIHIERFTADRPSAALAAQMAALQQEAVGLTLNVTLDGRTRRVAFDGANILDSARDAGMPAPFACKAGVCATCRARVMSGKVEMAARYGLTDEEVAAGYVLTCQSVPVGEGVAVDYDA